MESRNHAVRTSQGGYQPDIYTDRCGNAIADEACTSPKTARKHLNTLVADGFVATRTGDNGATLYRRSAESLVVEQAGEILSQVSTEDLRDRITEMREQLTDFQREYGVDSPEELAIDRTNELLDESGNGGKEPDDETIREWKTTRRNLSFTPRSRLRTQRSSSKPNHGRTMNPVRLRDR